jgi:hypothetical protein
MGLFQFCGTELEADLCSAPFTDASATGNYNPLEDASLPQSEHVLPDRDTSTLQFT